MSTEAMQEVERKTKLKKAFEAWVVEKGYYNIEQIRKRKPGTEEYLYLGMNELWTMWNELFAKYQNFETT